MKKILQWWEKNYRITVCVMLVVLVNALVLLWYGQPGVAECAPVAFWTGTVNGCENSQQMTDWYTLSHVIHGFLFFGLLYLVTREKISIGVKLIIATIMESAWELLENSHFIIDRYRTVTAAFGYNGDSILNSSFDILSVVLGFYLAWKLPVRVSIALVILMELVALYAVRDNLTLNIIMLIHPIKAIQIWQLGV